MELSILLLLLIAPVLILIKNVSRSGTKTSSPIPKSYPLIGMEIARHKNMYNLVPWMTEILKATPTLTFTFRRFFLFPEMIVTANPDNVRHILKTSFCNYQKGPEFRSTFFDFLGHGIFNADGESWKFQRQVASHEFNTKSLRKFIETVVDAELRDRLIPLLKSAAEMNRVLDLQDVLQRFAFDNVCQIAFGYDPEYLTIDLLENEFAKAFEHATLLTSFRVFSIFPTIWKLKRFFQLGSEKDLSKAVEQVRQLARNIVLRKKTELEKLWSDEENDLLSRFLSSGHSDENFMVDIVISFILAGRGGTSAALTWFFWLIHINPKSEAQIRTELFHSTNSSFEEVREMTYTHAALCESMRFYPPVPSDGKIAMQNDILPDGTKVTKGMRVVYHPYAMGRMEKIWGADWEDFKPERWLQKDETSGKVKLVNVDNYKYPVFQAGPRICLGKDMSFLQMKRVVAGILSEFKVVPAIEGFQPEFTAQLTLLMKGGFPDVVCLRKKRPRNPSSHFSEVSGRIVT